MWKPAFPIRVCSNCKKGKCRTKDSVVLRWLLMDYFLNIEFDSASFVEVNELSRNISASLILFQFRTLDSDSININNIHL